MHSEQFIADLDEVLSQMRSLLISKNAAYGDAALTPMRVFSSSNPVEQINVRIDDKLSRIGNGKTQQDTEDSELDLLGYLILKRIAIARIRGNSND